MSRKGYDESSRKSSSSDGGSHGPSGASGKVGYLLWRFYHLVKYFNWNIFKRLHKELQMLLQLDIGCYVLYNTFFLYKSHHMNKYSNPILKKALNNQLPNTMISRNLIFRGQPETGRILQPTFKLWRG